MAKLGIGKYSQSRYPKHCYLKVSTYIKEYSLDEFSIFSSPGQSPGRAIVLPPASAAVATSALAFYVKVFCVMCKALSGELSCP